MNRLAQEQHESPTLSAQAQTVLSLFEDINAAENRIPPGATDAWLQVKELVNGDLMIAKREASKLSGDEGRVLSARAALTEARLYYRFAIPISKDYKSDLRHAASRAESACATFPTALSYLLLGQIRAALGENERAKDALTVAAEGDSGVVGVEARKELLRFERHREVVADELAINKGCAGVAVVVGALLFLTASLTSPIFFLIGAVMVLAGGFGFIKALLGRR